MNIRVSALPFIPLLAALLLGGCPSINSDIEVADGETADRSLNTVNGSIHIGSESRVNGSAKTVNGSIVIGENSVVSKKAETVNGKISLGSGARASGVGGVNGSIEIGPGAEIAGDAETVNGMIVVGPDATVDGAVASVNGQIRIRGATVGRLKNTEGGIVLEAGSRVLGELRITRQRGSSRDKPLTVEIHADSEVAGPLVFEREVTLRIHESATVGEIRGAEPEYFND